MDRLTEFKEWFINLNEATLDEIVYYYDENVFLKIPSMNLMEEKN